MNITVLNRLFEIGEIKTMNSGLDVIRALDEVLGYPSQAFASIHIAGTNGKGSVTTKIARSLQVATRKVGLYTSPHLRSFRERIEVNGECIPEEKAEKLLGVIFDAADKLKVKPSYFEVLTLLSFLYFADQNIEVAALEVGMGGRLDATNIVTPLLSVITSIGLDHTRYLGNTVDAIAKEKAGIIKPHVPVVVGPKAAVFPIFSQVAKENGCPFHPLLEAFEDYESENRAIAQFALDFLPFQEKNEKGIEVTPLCRFQKIEKEIPIILDVGHNPEALKALFTRVNAAFPGKKICAVVAFSSDKEIEPSLEMLMKERPFIFLTEAPHMRAEPARALETRLQQKNYGCMEVETDIKKAFSKARHRAFQTNGIVVVCGTFFIMNVIFAALEEEKVLCSD